MSGTVSRASPICHLVVDAKELMTDALAVLAPMRLVATVDVDRDPYAVALASPRDVPTLVLSGVAPTMAQAIACGDRNGSRDGFVLASCSRPNDRVVLLAPELGLPMLPDVGSAIAAALFAHATRSLGVGASTKGLGGPDRQRLPHAHDVGDRLVRMDEGILGLVTEHGTTPLGRVDDLDRAFAALARTHRGDRPSLPRVEEADRAAALDVLMGPARTLSDPASKAALEAYDLPLPVEELCATASRASSESSRIGYPVRIALASPELRASEHPDLVVEGVEGSARVRDTFRELVALAERKDASARILGVTVSASTTARCTLRITAERIAASRLVATIGFADPHGRVTEDETHVVLPTTPADVRSAILSLRGASLLAEGGSAPRDVVLMRLTDIVLRLAAFMDDFPEEVGEVMLDPIAVLHADEVEIREASVRVTDAFSRQLR